MTSEQFVDLLDQLEVISPSHIDSLREQMAAAEQPFHPSFIARRLVQMGYLNSYFAKTLLAVGHAKDAHQLQPGEEYELAPLEEEIPDDFGAEVEAEYQDLQLDLPPLEDADMLRVPATDPVLRPNVAPLANPAAHQRSRQSNIPLPLKLAMGAAILLVVFIVGMIASSVLFGR